MDTLGYFVTIKRAYLDDVFRVSIPSENSWGRLMPWTNWGEPINRDEMLCFVKQIRNRCNAIIQFLPSDESEIIYTLLEDIYEDAQAIATGYSAFSDCECERHNDATDPYRDTIFTGDE